MKGNIVRFVTATTALCYDSKNDHVVKVTTFVDSLGRVWERYNDGPILPVASPEEPPDSD